MSHRFGRSMPTPLTNFSANAEDEGYQLIIHVVSVNDQGELTLPVRELWCSTKEPGGELTFLASRSDTPDDDEEEKEVSFARANEILDDRCVRLLKPKSPFGVAGRGGWYVTALAKVEPRIWKRKQGWDGKSYYTLNEDNLRTWLANGAEGADEYDNEEDWWCLTHDGHSSDAAQATRASVDKTEGDPSKDKSDEHANEGSRRWTSAQNLPPRMLGLMPKALETEEFDDGYDGDVEKGRIGAKRYSNGVRL